MGDAHRAAWSNELAHIGRGRMRSPGEPVCVPRSGVRSEQLPPRACCARDSATLNHWLRLSASSAKFGAPARPRFTSSSSISKCGFCVASACSRKRSSTGRVARSNWFRRKSSGDMASSPNRFEVFRGEVLEVRRDNRVTASTQRGGQHVIIVWIGKRKSAFNLVQAADHRARECCVHDPHALFD